MAKSPAHRFGQIIGEILEQAVEPVLRTLAKKHGLFLDKKGHRPCRPALNLTWTDDRGNAHDLDFVLERGGTRNSQGFPAAFIEVAWRRYTKHSRAKAQEIQGAILPLLDKHKNSAPFIGAILAGVFTKGSLKQLESLGFAVLYIPTESIVKVLKKYGISADTDEDTLDSEFQKGVDTYEALQPTQKVRLAQSLLHAHKSEVDVFVAALERVLSRQIERIIIVPLHGLETQYVTVDSALNSLQGFSESKGSNKFVRYEIEIRYDNGNTVNGSFKLKEDAIVFLKLYRPSTQVKG